jgi:two-component system, cell cycle sensor histidine kinase and response regulator CckA
LTLPSDDLTMAEACILRPSGEDATLDSTTQADWEASTESPPERDLESSSDTMTPQVTGRADLLHRVAELEAMFELAAAVNRSESGQSLAERAIEALLRVLPIDRAAVLLSDGAGTLRFAAWRGLSDEYRHTVEGHSPWAPGETAPGPVLIADAATDDSLGHLREIDQVEGIRSLAYVPICHEDRLLGELALYCNEPHACGDEEVAFATAIATHVAVAIHRSGVEAELKREREKFLMLADNVPLGLVAIDQGGSYTYVNAKFKEIFGYELEEVPDRETWRRLAYPDPTYRARVGEAWAEDAGMRQSHRTRRRSFWVTCKEGDRKLVELTSTVLADGSSLMTCEDTSERQRAEAARQEVEDRYRTLAESSPDMIFIVDRDGMVNYANPAAGRLFGRPAHELLGKRQEDLFPEAQASRHLRAIRRIFDLGEPLAREDSVQVGGEEVWLDSRLVPLHDSSGRVREVLGISRDATQRRLDAQRLHQREEQLRQAQKMEAVGQLAGGVAHDFNNLLQALLSSLQVLRVRSEPERLGELLEDLETLVKRGASLTRQLLLFSRRDTPRAERIDLNETVLDVSKMLRRLVRENIQIRLELASDPLWLDADPGQIGQVLMNLALNASDAMPDGGEMVLGTGRLPDGSVWLEVADTGTGIAPELQGRIFEPFFTTKSSGQGTGLGLSVVEGIVLEHGGRIELESQPGQGSVFRVVLAGRGVATSGGEQRAEPGSEPGRGRGERVLLVEDEPGAREALAEILRYLGYDVTSLVSAEEAAALPIEAAFDLLLTDVLLPGMPGDRLGTVLRERWPELEVILMSGYTQDEALRQVLRDGSLRFLQKPFDMEVLAREMRAALDRPGNAS